MIQSSTFSVQPEHGFISGWVEGVIAVDDSRPFNPAAIAYLDQRFPEAVQPEVTAKGADRLPPRTKQVLGWLFQAMRQLHWPVFQLGQFMPRQDGCDLSGRFRLPSQHQLSLSPLHLLNFVLEKALLTDPEHWNEADFAQQIEQGLDRMAPGGVSIANRRVILSQLARRSARLHEISSQIYQIGEGRDARFVRGTMTQEVGVLGMALQADKVATADLLALHGVPTVLHQTASTLAAVLKCAEQIGYPVVLKPRNGAQGRDVHVNIQGPEALQSIATDPDFPLRHALVERFVPGGSLRIMCAKGQIIYVSLKAHVLLEGDGSSTLRDLIADYCALAILDEHTLKEAIAVDTFLDKNNIVERIEKVGRTLDHVLEPGETFEATLVPSVIYGARIDLLDIETLSPNVRAQIQTMFELFGEGSLGIDAIGDIETDTLVFNEVNYGPEINYLPQVAPHYMATAYPELDKA